MLCQVYFWSKRQHPGKTDLAIPLLWSRTSHRWQPYVAVAILPATGYSPDLSRCSLTDSILIRGRQDCCGARPVVARTDFQPPQWQSAHRPSPRCPRYVTWAYSSTPTWWCALTCVRRCRAALLHSSPRLGDRLSVACYCFSTQPDYDNGVLIGLPIHLISRLQSVQNAAARLILRGRRSDRITDAFICLHWLRVPEKYCVQGRSADLPGTARWCPSVPTEITPVANIPSRQRLLSSTSDDLCVPAVRLPNVGRRVFSVAGARVWNALPADVTSAPSLFTFRKRLKLHLFPLSYPGLVL